MQLNANATTYSVQFKARRNSPQFSPRPLLVKAVSSNETHQTSHEAAERIVRSK